ncbi:class I lanthipeptide [Spirosoma oryzicola]|uniref:class I lanthipeptide n=1 Tax=Spirosoma oryzicola TaxID=2898794 RepID=UPI001E469558|nr:class I lanthipeptide [Spirosoma oryzicola]UHG94935.1 class I lanthipeptide [Spirosoma oryzicola]
MKKKPVKIDQLDLDKETISRLSDNQLMQIEGGEERQTLSCAGRDEAAEIVTQSCCYLTCNDTN